MPAPKSNRGVDGSYCQRRNLIGAGTAMLPFERNQATLVINQNGQPLPGGFHLSDASCSCQPHESAKAARANAARTMAETTSAAIGICGESVLEKSLMSGMRDPPKIDLEAASAAARFSFFEGPALSRENFSCLMRLTLKTHQTGRR